MRWFKIFDFSKAEQEYKDFKEKVALIVFM